MKNIKEFCNMTGMKFHTGEVGFGRPCLGIIDPSTESYLAYNHYNYDTDEYLIEHTVASESAPSSAYHEGPYLAVLYSGEEEDRANAIYALDQWIGDILKAGFEMGEFTETNSITALLRGGSVSQKCLKNKV